MSVITMSGLNSYVQDDGNAQKQTHITFKNPSHPDIAAEGEEAEQMARQFNAANAIQSSAIDRTALVGDFLDAVQREHINGEEGAIMKFAESLQDE